MLGRGAELPDFCAEQPHTHPYETMVEMRKHHVVPASCQDRIEYDGANLMGVRVSKSLSTECPTSRQSWQAKYWGSLSNFVWVRPNTVYFDGDQRRLGGKF